MYNNDINYAVRLVFDDDELYVKNPTCEVVLIDLNTMETKNTGVTISYVNYLQPSILINEKGDIYIYLSFQGEEKYILIENK